MSYEVTPNITEKLWANFESHIRNNLKRKDTGDRDALI
jgi:hypothetical protein